MSYYETLKTLNAEIQENWNASLRAASPDRRRFYQDVYLNLATTRDILRLRALEDHIQTVAGCQSVVPQWDEALTRMSRATYEVSHRLKDTMAK